MKSEDMTELLQKNEKRLDCTTVFISKCIHLIFDVRTSPLHVSYICIKKNNNNKNKSMFTLGQYLCDVCVC